MNLYTFSVETVSERCYRSHEHEFVVMLYWIVLYCKVLLFIICVQWVQIKLKLNSNVEIKPSVTTKLHFDTPYI